jgi:hypothetical protein
MCDRQWDALKTSGAVAAGVRDKWKLRQSPPRLVHAFSTRSRSGATIIQLHAHHIIECHYIEHNLIIYT